MPDTKTVVGRCTEISERSGWTTFHIDIGTQWPIKLATKLEKMITAGRAVGDREAAWIYTEKESDRINEHTGKPFINKYLDGVREPGSMEADPHADDGPVADRGAPPREADTTPQPQHTPLRGGDKDRAITRMACIRSAAQTLAGTHDGKEDLEIGVRVLELAQRYELWVMRDIDDLPFS